MHLKSIELVGFKSFAEKTAIELKPGISGVVGPNGCGKSNIVDALRWCLGEMSAKSLRSKQMLDVIFAGASGRSPLNLAEVTLTFDNTHRLLPLDFSEIQVTRRLFRSGESEYFLNRTQCRLKDIRDLFLDTGLHEGYSILAQGEVDFVMHAKPEERRELFEEAAGISKYKARREEALRKLEKVEIDLNRLNDLISVVKEQMEALEAAARRAKLFQKIKEELKGMEITDALHKMVSYDEQIKSAEARMEELRAEHQKSTTELDSAEAALTRYHIDQDAAEKEIYANQVSVLELDKSINGSDTAVRTEKEREKEFEDRISKLKEKIAVLQLDGGTLEKKRREAEEELKGASEKLGVLNASHAKAEEARESARGQRGALEEQAKGLSDEIFRLSSDLAAAGNEKNSSSSLQIHKESELASSVRELDKTEAARKNLEQDLASLRSKLSGISGLRAGMKERAEKAKSELKASLEKETSLDRQIQSLRIALAHARAQKEVLEVRFYKDPYHKGTQRILNQGPTGLRGVVGLLFKYPPHMSHWIESALGAKMSYLVFDKLSEAQEALEWIRARGLGRARCVILEKMPDTPVPDLSPMPNANSLTNFVQCAPEILPLKKYLFGQSFLAGSTLYDAGFIDGGSDFAQVEGSNESAVETFQNEFLALSNLEREISSNEELLKTLEKDFFEAEGSSAALKITAESEDREAEKLVLQEEHSLAVAAAKEEEVRLSTREADFLKESQVQMQKELSGIAERIESCSGRVRDISARLAEKEAARAALQGEIEACRASEHGLEVAAKETEIRFETFNSEFESLKETGEEWREQLERSLKDRESSLSEMEVYQTKVEESRARAEHEAENIGKRQEDKNRLSLVIEELLKVKAQREESNRAFLEQIQKTRENQSQMTESLHQIELDLRTIQGEKRNIVSRMQETYQVSLEQIESEFKPEPVDAEEIGKLRKRVDTMANSVNLEAPQQHEALSERYNFLNVQTQDLMKAREDLKSAIQQINGTTREQFKETFHKVRENFQKIYATLFEGGTADLVFTDESNILETGVDIVAQPPGKKLQNIALLSGGEKALTAISLLFAFFMVKPSPFCILDEVDAPWDPANVARFLNLLKEFTSNIQFLVVTHNPRTMEMADVLYGVTMQEFGISKILSMRLKKEAPASASEEQLTPA